VLERWAVALIKYLCMRVLEKVGRNYMIYTSHLELLSGKIKEVTICCACSSEAGYKKFLLAAASSWMEDNIKMDLTECGVGVAYVWKWFLMFKFTN
jgi:hypothetical protein